MRVSLVTTTINIPTLLEDYVKDMLEHGHNTIDIIVAGDYKTKPGAEEFCQKIQRDYKVETIYMDVNAQNDYMKKYPALDKFLPFNCIQRRNVAILNAYERGADIIVTIDDDNFLAQKNYFKAHEIVGNTVCLPVIAAENGWLNICKWLEDKNDRKFYPRGYPVLERHQDSPITETIADARIVVNGGFWLGDPDIDAVTRLAAPIDVTRYTRKDNFALAIGTYTPFNSQNTALHRSIIPAYFLCPRIGRYDDIWASYFIKAISDHLGDYIAFGPPLVQQNRNAHNLWVDLEHERLGMQLTDQLCTTLRQIKLSGTDYKSCAIELTTKLQAALPDFMLNTEQREFFQQFVEGYHLWVECFV